MSQPPAPVPALAPHVLVVDDDASLFRMIRLSLATEGLRVTTTEDGIDGLEQLDADSYDLVVLDLQMPRIDGRTMFTEMRVRGHALPVMFLSAYGAAQARRELGAEDAMSKPFDIDDLINRVRALIEPAHAAQD